MSSVVTLTAVLSVVTLTAVSSVVSNHRPSLCTMACPAGSPATVTSVPSGVPPRHSSDPYSVTWHVMNETVRHGDMSLSRFKIVMTSHEQANKTILTCHELVKTHSDRSLPRQDSNM